MKINLHFCILILIFSNSFLFAENNFSVKITYGVARDNTLIDICAGNIDSISKETCFFIKKLDLV